MGLRIVLGARPARALVVYEGAADAADYEAIAERTAFGGNLRASEAFRKKVAPVLMARAAAACLDMMQEGNTDEH